MSSGLFVLPGLAHARAGPAVCISYALAGLLALIGILNTVELTTAMPKAGGDYFFISRSLGPALGAVSGLLSWFAMSMKSTFALVGMGAFAALVLGIDVQRNVLTMQVMSAGFCLVFVVLNIVGVKEASRLQVVLVAGLLVLLGLYVATGLPAMKARHLRPFMPGGLKSVFFTAGFVFVSYGGVLQISSIAEEIRDPARNIPRGMIFSVLMVTVLYTLAVLVTTGVLTGSQLDFSLTPISDGAQVSMGRWGRWLLSLGAALAFISTANAGIMSASRYPLALSRDGLLPECLGAVSRRFKTPYVSILVTGAFMVAALFLTLDVLVKAASAVLLLAYLFAAVAIVVLRESGLKNYQPTFRAPFYPWIQILGTMGFLFLLFELGWVPLLLSSGLIAAGFATYWLYGRIRNTSEYALLHLVKRIIEKLKATELVTGTLEDELRDILHERDTTDTRKLERIVRAAAVLDIQEAVSLEEFFGRVSAVVAERLDTDPARLCEQFLARERTASTVLRNGLAMPHICIEGEHKLQIVLARAARGVPFSEEEPDVSIIIVIVATADERHFHLHILSELAQTIQDPHFDRAWLEAEDEEALRNLALRGQGG